MDKLDTLLFDVPWAALFGLLLLSVPLLYAARHGQGLRRWLPAVPLALAGALLLADWAVQTDREEIADVLDRTAEAMRTGQLDALEELLAPHVELTASGQRWTAGRDAAIAQARAAGRVYPIATWQVRNLQVALETDDLATASYAIVSTAAGPSPLAGRPAVTKWLVTLHRQPDDRWQITTIDLLSLNDQPMPDLPRWLDRLPR